MLAYADVFQVRGLETNDCIDFYQLERFINKHWACEDCLRAPAPASCVKHQRRSVSILTETTHLVSVSITLS